VICRQTSWPEMSGKRRAHQQPLTASELWVSRKKPNNICLRDKVDLSASFDISDAGQSHLRDLCRHRVRTTFKQSPTTNAFTTKTDLAFEIPPLNPIFMPSGALPAHEVSFELPPWGESIRANPYLSPQGQNAIL
jgi:hypothetical protein